MHGRAERQAAGNRRRRGAAAPTTCRPSSPPPGGAPDGRPRDTALGRLALAQAAFNRPTARPGTSRTSCSAAGASCSSTRRTTPSSTTTGDTSRSTPRSRRGCGSRSASTASRQAGCATRRPAAAGQTVTRTASTSCSDHGRTGARRYRTRRGPAQLSLKSRDGNPGHEPRARSMAERSRRRRGAGGGGDRSTEQRQEGGESPARDDGGRPPGTEAAWPDGAARQATAPAHARSGGQSPTRCRSATREATCAPADRRASRAGCATGPSARQ